MALSRRQFIQGISACAAALAAPRVLRANILSAVGLSGDGNTNVLPEIEALIREAEHRGKGDIELPPGRFLLVPPDRQSAIILPANVNLRGAGRDQTTLVMARETVGHVVTATFGYSQITDLTIDGNEAQREGKVGHGLRVGGENVLAERIRVVNAPSYGIAISQRNYGRNITIRDVLIENAGADGIDVKNRLHHTTGILIENVTVSGFGRPLRSLDKALVGTQADVRRNKAAVDLRGRCEVRNLTVNGILRDRDGLRFRPGEGGENKSVGAHGSKASNVLVRASPGVPAVNGIAVVARDVQISNARIEGAQSGILVIASNLKVQGGTVRNSLFALNVRENRLGNPAGLVVTDVTFESCGFRIQPVEPAPSFQNCSFTNCKAPVDEVLQKSGAQINGASFDGSCAILK